MSTKLEHICIGVCTYRRPDFLNRCLAALQNQAHAGLFTYSIIVVDNDKEKSAQKIIAAHQKNSMISILYFVEPEQNISMARNKAMKEADGHFFAGIDDDELADQRWLVSLYLTAKKYSADGVLGPVLPSYETSPPRWMVKGGYFNRKSFPTGTIIADSRHTRAGNFFINHKIIEETDRLFKPELGRTGGEDVDFFKRLIKNGYIFIWCDEARVYEITPIARLSKSYLIKRALMRGIANSNSAPLISGDSLKSLFAILVYFSYIPVVFLFKHYAYFRYVIKICDHLGKVLARCGIPLVKQRPI